MLRFTVEQIEAINDRSDEEMGELWARIVREVYPDEVSHLSEEDLLAESCDRVREARFAGLEDGEDVGLYVQACLFLSPEFPERMPDLARVLLNDEIPFEEREDALTRHQTGLLP